MSADQKSRSQRVQFSITDEKWGILFDEDNNPTKRLGQLLRGIANYIVKKTVSTPRALQNAFPRLPKELRLKIWEMTKEESRFIIRSSLCPSGRGIWSPTPVPALQHVCAESRTIAFKTYKLSFSVSSQEEFSFPAQIYFNFARDVLYFRSGGPYKGLQHFDEFMAACLPADRQRVRAVGLDIVAKAQSYASTLYNTTDYIMLYGAKIRSSFERLETFLICQERARFNAKRAIQFSPLQKDQEWAFVKHYT